MEIVVVINIRMLFFIPESVPKFVVVFYDVELGIDNDNRGGYAANESIGLALRLLFHVGYAHVRFGLAF